MEIGDLVERKIKGPIDSQLVAKSGKFYSIAERLVEVISESR